jgi:hypothetical protein
MNQETVIQLVMVVPVVGVVMWAWGYLLWALILPILMPREVDKHDGL